MIIKNRAEIAASSKCPVCFTQLHAIDTYDTSKKIGNEWITRWFDIDWVIQNHIKRAHKSKPKPTTKELSIELSAVSTAKKPFLVPKKPPVFKKNVSEDAS